MSREEARQNLIALGIAEPTDAQVTNYLNQFHANRNQQPAPQQNPAPAPTPQPAPSQNPAPDNPAPNEEMERLRQQIAKLQSDNAKKDILAYATEKGLSGEHVANVLAAYGDNVESAKTSIDAICSIISAKETAAATAKEQEIANKATNPGGGSGGNGEKEKTNAEKLASKFFGEKKSENSVISHYVTGGNFNV